MHLTGGPEPHIWEVYVSFSTKGRVFELLQDKDIPFGYDDAKFQTRKLNHLEVMGSEVHPGNGYISKNSMLTTKF